MSKKFVTGIFLLVLILAMLWIVEPQQENNDKNNIAFEKSKEIAIEWIENNSPTYSNDGFNLTLKEEEEIIKNSTYKFSFDFYAKDEEQESINLYHMKVIVDKEEVIIAVTDNIFCEIEEKTIKNY